MAAPFRCVLARRQANRPAPAPQDLLTLRVRPPGIEWKTGEKPKMGKNWPKIENGPQPTARNGGKMAQKIARAKIEK